MTKKERIRELEKRNFEIEETIRFLLKDRENHLKSWEKTFLALAANIIPEGIRTHPRCMDHSIGNRFGSPKTTMPLVLNMAMASTIAIAKMMATFTMAAETCAANENDGDVDDNVDSGDEQLVTETSAIAKCFGVHA